MNQRLADHVTALVGGLAAHRAQVTQRPFGNRAAVDRRQQLGGRQPHADAVEPDAHQHPVCTPPCDTLQPPKRASASAAAMVRGPCAGCSIA